MSSVLACQKWATLCDNDSDHIGTALLACPFLPENQGKQEEGGNPVEETFLVANEHLSKLLRMKLPRFLSHVLLSKTFHEWLHAFFAFASRAFEYSQADAHKGKAEAFRRVFAVFKRLTGMCDVAARDFEQLSLVPPSDAAGVKACEVDARGRFVLYQKLLLESSIIRPSTLLDFSAIFGPVVQLTDLQVVCGHFIHLLPHLVLEVGAAMEPIAKVLSHLNSTTSGILAKYASGSHATNEAGEGSLDASLQLLDSMRYFLDICGTLHFLVKSRPKLFSLLLILPSQMVAINSLLYNKGENSIKLLKLREAVHSAIETSTPEPSSVLGGLVEAYECTFVGVATLLRKWVTNERKGAPDIDPSYVEELRYTLHCTCQYIVQISHEFIKQAYFKTILKDGFTDLVMLVQEERDDDQRRSFHTNSLMFDFSLAEKASAGSSSSGGSGGSSAFDGLCACLHHLSHFSEQQSTERDVKTLANGGKRLRNPRLRSDKGGEKATAAKAKNSPRYPGLLLSDLRETFLWDDVFLRNPSFSQVCRAYARI
jgi:hypothetical protein